MRFESGAGLLVWNNSEPSLLPGVVTLGVKRALGRCGERGENCILCWVLLISVPRNQSDKKCVCTEYFCKSLCLLNHSSPTQPACVFALLLSAQRLHCNPGTEMLPEGQELYPLDAIVSPTFVTSS